MLYNTSNHLYTLAATGIKLRSREFSHRRDAEDVMYKVIGKKNLRIIERYDDKHYKTYVCENGIKFYINRV